MNYHPDDFLSLVDEIEAQGGRHLQDKCTPQKFHLKQPTADGMRWADFFTTGCDRDVRFEVAPLHGPELDGALGEADGLLMKHGYRLDFDPEHGDDSPVVICAIDDDVGRWPRFAHAMQSGMST